MAPSGADKVANEAAGVQDTKVTARSGTAMDGVAVTENCATKDAVNTVQVTDITEVDRDAIGTKSYRGIFVTILPECKHISIPLTQRGDDDGDEDDEDEDESYDEDEDYDGETHRLYAFCYRRSIVPLFTQGVAAGICRQIRAESLNLQFKLNIFYIDSMSNVDSLVQRLTTSQKSAIQYMSLAGYGLVGCANLIHEFPGIKRIYYDGGSPLPAQTSSKLLGVDVVYVDVTRI